MLDGGRYHASVNENLLRIPDRLPTPKFLLVLLFAILVRLVAGRLCLCFHFRGVFL